jgi:hypothetical protein
MAGAVLTGTLAMAATAGVFGVASGVSLTAGGALQSFGGATGVGGQNFRNGAASTGFGTGFGLALGALGSNATRGLSVFQRSVQNFANNGVTIAGGAVDALSAAFPDPSLADCSS